LQQRIEIRLLAKTQRQLIQKRHVLSPIWVDRVVGIKSRHRRVDSLGNTEGHVWRRAREDERVVLRRGAGGLGRGLDGQGRVTDADTLVWKQWNRHSRRNRLAVERCAVRAAEVLQPMPTVIVENSRVRTGNPQVGG